MAKTSASFTLMDYTDGISLITGIDSNLPFTSMYDTTTQKLTPDWSGSTSLQLTPNVIKAGSASQLPLTGMKWERRIAGGSWTPISSDNGESMSGSTGVLTVKKNALTGSVNQIEYKFSATYTDPVLHLNFPVEIKCTFSRVMNGTSFVVARAYTVNGNQFKNNQPSSLSIKAELIRGTTHDETDLKYEWKKSTNGSTWSSVGGNTATLSVTPGMVDNFAMFQCTITDTDATSETYNQKFVTEGISILDLTDPYQAVIESSAGTYFKNNVGETVLRCRVFQNGVEVDTAGTGLTYSWTKNLQNGSPDTAFNAQKKKGKTLTVTHSDVDVKAVYFCEVS